MHTKHTTYYVTKHSVYLPMTVDVKRKVNLAKMPLLTEKTEKALYYLGWQNPKSLKSRPLDIEELGQMQKALKNAKKDEAYNKRMAVVKTALAVIAVAAASVAAGLAFAGIVVGTGGTALWVTGLVILALYGAGSIKAAHRFHNFQDLLFMGFVKRAWNNVEQKRKTLKSLEKAHKRTFERLRTEHTGKIGKKTIKAFKVHMESLKERRKNAHKSCKKVIDRRIRYYNKAFKNYMERHNYFNNEAGMGQVIKKK